MRMESIKNSNCFGFRTRGIVSVGANLALSLPGVSTSRLQYAARRCLETSSCSSLARYSMPRGRAHRGALCRSGKSREVFLVWSIPDALLVDWGGDFGVRFRRKLPRVWHRMRDINFWSCTKMPKSQSVRRTRSRASHSRGEKYHSLSRNLELSARSCARDRIARRRARPIDTPGSILSREHARKVDTRQPTFLACVTGHRTGLPPH